MRRESPDPHYLLQTLSQVKGHIVSTLVGGAGGKSMNTAYMLSDVASSRPLGETVLWEKISTNISPAWTRRAGGFCAWVPMTKGGQSDPLPPGQKTRWEAGVQPAATWQHSCLEKRA
jgi:hypothetical protein